MDPNILTDISELTVEEICAHVLGVLQLPRLVRTKSALLDYVMTNAGVEQLEFLRQAGQEKCSNKSRDRQAAELTRKRKRNEQQNTRRVAQREAAAHDNNADQLESSSAHFLELLTDTQVKACYRAFYKATPNEAMATAICGICARTVNIIADKVVRYPLNSLPNVYRLNPKIPHHDHTLFNGKLLEPNGVEGQGSDALVTVCRDCFESLQKPADNPPPYSLANNMWIGQIPWQLQRLTFPEQLLVALIYPRVYVFKLFPKKIGGVRDASTLQRGMQGNVSSYELNVEDLSSMIHGHLMPWPPAILASVISVTFIGVGHLQKQWLHSTFRVRRQFVFEALHWLKENNPKYYGHIEIDSSRIEKLPEDDIPLEILGIVRQSADVGLVDQESAGYVLADDGRDTGEP